MGRRVEFHSVAPPQAPGVQGTRGPRRLAPHVDGHLLPGLRVPAVPQQWVLDVPRRRQLGGVVRGRGRQHDVRRGACDVLQRVGVGLPGRAQQRARVPRDGRLRVARGAVRAGARGGGVRGAARVPRRAVRRAGDHLLRDARAVDHAPLHAGRPPRALRQLLAPHRRRHLPPPHAPHLWHRHPRRPLHAQRHGRRVPRAPCRAAGQDPHR
mmetsp:Transcript_58362/g.137376  ORF Transcript_58362/g.137376 Transcript_58362/m.137376 type:complete len:210 (-) Transcript_58362:180-809(-)